MSIKNEEIISRIERIEKKVEGVGLGISALRVYEVLKQAGLDEVLDEVANKVLEQLAKSIDPKSTKRIIERLSETLKEAIRDEGTA